jgi:uncharacterized protein
MRRLLGTILFATSLCCADQSSSTRKALPAFDEQLAKRLGADEMGMRSYIFVLLTTGPKDSEVLGETRSQAFAGHMANIQALAKNGKLAVAGPFSKNEHAYRGMFVLATNSIEQAKSWVEQDPAVKLGILTPEYTPWYGSAALMMTNEVHHKIAKKLP